MNFIDDGTYEVEYEHTNRTITDGDYTNMEFITSKWNSGTINAEKKPCHSYYIIKISSSLYTFKNIWMYMYK